MKRIAFLVVAGIFPLLAVVVFMKFISLNLSYSLLVGVFSIFGISIWQNKNKENIFLKAALISLPLSIAYFFLIIQELPGLWIAIPLYFIAAIWGSVPQKRTLKAMVTLGLIAFTSLISQVFVPKIISENLSQIINIPVPNFEILDLLTREKINNSSLKNKVVVLDFFGTWCAPCIAEMKELKEIKEFMADVENELEFIIACTDTGGDTPEKAKEFHALRKLPFVLAYDTNSMLHRSFGFTGVPGLVIIDKKGKMRLKHEGYNQAENLKKTLIPIIRELLNATD